MKRFIFSIILASVCCLNSCNKDVASVTPELIDDENTVLTVSLNEQSGMSTKVVGDTDEAEKTFQNVQVFVFRKAAEGSGEPEVLDACLSKGFDTPLSYVATGAYTDIQLNCTVGSRDVWVIVNAATDFCSDGSIKTKSDLLAKTASLSDLSANSLLMTGDTTIELKPGNSLANVTVRRLCAKVVLESVTNNMESVAYQGADCFRIKDVYLTNVPAIIDYNASRKAADLNEASWYAKKQKESDPNKYKLILDTQSPVTLDYNDSYDTKHTFYTFPNECASNEEDTWSPRATRLVVEAEFYDGSTYHTCYYPITLYNEEDSIGIQRNHQYTVKLTVKRPGSDNPDKKVVFETVSGSITVADWETGYSYEETI